MKKISLFFATALLLCSHSTLLRAQDGQSLIEKLERVTKEKEPTWKLDRKLPSDVLIVLRWSSGEERIFMSITLLASSGKAKEIYESSVATVNEKLGPKAKKSTVPNLGDQNQLWSGHNDDASAGLEFRQGKVHVLLFAPSEEVAKRFGRYVADLLPPPKTTQAENSAQAWKEYSSIEGGFSIQFPGTPTQETQVIEPGPNVRFTLHIHRLTALAEYSVMYADYPIPVSDPAVAKQVLDEGAKGAVAAVRAQLLELKEIELFGYQGRYLKERMPGGEIMRVNMVLVGQRMYQVAITTPAEEGKSAETVKTYQAMTDKFLRSFKLLAKREQRAARTESLGAIHSIEVNRRGGTW